MADNLPQTKHEGPSATTASSPASSASPQVPVLPDLPDLPGLDTVDWASLDHAYGEATDTPKWLQGLYHAAVSSSSSYGSGNGFAVAGTTATGASYTVVDEAFAELDASITHQGSRYAASCAAVPFVYTILEAAEKKHDTLRAELLTLLGALAVGSPKHWLPSRAEIADWRASTAARQSPQWPREEMARRDAFVEEARRKAEASNDWSTFRRQEFRVELMTEPEQMTATSLAELGTYDGVRAGLKSVYDCLHDEYPNVRSEAAFLLALFPEPETAAVSEQKLRDQLARETVATVRGTILLTLGMLRAKPKSTPALVDDNREKDVHEDMHPKVEFVENDDDRAARASVRQLLEDVHSVATAKKEAETDGAADADAHFEQWCSATALLLLVGVGERDDKVLTDVLAPLLDGNRVLSRYEPKQLQVEARRRRSGQKSERRGEQSEEKKEGEQSEEKKEGERSEEEEMKEESFPFPDDDLTSFVAPLLQDIRGSEHPDVAQAVIDNVVGAKSLSGIELANTALQLAFDGTRHEWLPYVYTGGDGADSAPKTTLPLFSELTPLQQSAVSAVAHVDGSCWKFANFKATLKSWGLPGDKMELDKYIDGKEFGKDAVEEESPEKKQRKSESRWK